MENTQTTNIDFDRNPELAAIKAELLRDRELAAVKAELAAIKAAIAEVKAGYEISRQKGDFRVNDLLTRFA